MYMALFGAIGGCLVPALNLATDLVYKKEPMPEFSFLFGLLILGVIGAVVAKLYATPNDHKSALITGISAPALIVALLSNATTKPPQPISISPINGPVSYVPAFIASAHAQPRPESPSLSDAQVEIGPQQTDDQYQIWFYNNNNKPIDGQVAENPTETQLFDIPTEATSFIIIKGGATSSSVSLEPRDGDPEPVKVTLEQKTSLRQDFLRAFGIKSEGELVVK